MNITNFRKINMKNNKPDEVQINISVIGLSGTETVKGIHGVGKSCLCNRLAQPNFYKHKHVSIISSIDFYGSIIHQSHWLYWSHINKEIRGKKYNFHFIEQTIFTDDSSFREFKTNAEPQDFVKRASMTELRINKNAYICNQKSDKSVDTSMNFEDKFTIQLFVLVFDVSEVEKRNGKQQEAVFKQLFDAVIATKRPVLVVTTKHDVASPSIVEKFRAIVEKKPYCRYPVVETSAKLDINIELVYNMAASLVESGVKSIKQLYYSYVDGFVARAKQDEIHRKEFLHIIERTLSEDNVFMSWDDFVKIEEISFFKKRFSLDSLCGDFKKLQKDLLFKKRSLNNWRFKEILQSLLKEFDHLIPLVDTPIETILGNLMKEKGFVSHFTDFDREMECFQFDHNCTNSKLIPMCLLDTEYENNLLFMISEYSQQKSLEIQLYQHLMEDSQKYFKKSIREIREELTRFAKHFIQDKVIKNVYDKFRDYCFSVIRRKFLDVIHENPNMFLSQNIFKFIENRETNGLSNITGSNNTKIPHEKKSDDSVFFQKMIKEINKLIDFDDLPIAKDENNMREIWIRDYITFLISKNENECIFQQTSQIPCSFSLINDSLVRTTSQIQIEESSNRSHVFYFTILGQSTSKASLEHAILSRVMNLPLKICKVHSSKYEVEIVSDLSSLKDVFINLSTANDKCSILCAVIIADKVEDLEQEVNELEYFLLHADSDILLTKYLMCNIDNINSQSVDSLLNDLVEKKKYMVIPLLPENQQQTIDWIVSNAQKSAEQSVIWLVTVCGDPYDYNTMVKFLMEAIKDFFSPFQMTKNTSTVIGASNEIIIQNYRLVFISYHQVLKLVIQSSYPPTVDAFIFVCSLDRLASINTCLALKKYLPSEIASVCHSMLLCIGEETNPIGEQVVLKCAKYGMEYGVYDINVTENDFHEDIKCKLFNFFKDILSYSGTLESTNSIPSNSSSLIKNVTNKSNDNLMRYLNRSMCQACCDSYKSDVSVNSNSSLANFQNNFLFESKSYDQVLGQANEDVFHFWSPEFMFDIAQDICIKCTKVKCDFHLKLESSDSSLKSFRTRIRSQSGPDLRNQTDFNPASSSRNDSTFYCSVCGLDIGKSPFEQSKLQSYRLMRQNGTKESPQKTFTAKLHDLFNPIKKLGETQVVDGRKSFIRTSSKRHK